MSLFDRKGEIIKPFMEMTELEKLEFLHGELEARRADLAVKVKSYDKGIAELSGELQRISEERERVAQQSVSTIAGAELLAQKIADMKQELAK